MNQASDTIEQPRHPTDPGPDIAKAAVVFGCLSNTIRLNALLRLIEREWSVNELAADLQISQSALSQHLGKLRQAGIVRKRRQRQAIFYHCSDRAAKQLLVEVGLLPR